MTASGSRRREVYVGLESEENEVMDYVPTPWSAYHGVSGQTWSAYVGGARSSWYDPNSAAAQPTEPTTDRPDRDDFREHVPEWDGKSEPLKTYARRVGIYCAMSRTAASRRGGKLLERLRGDAFEKTETLSPHSLLCDDGVQVLLKFLRGKYEPMEAIRVGRLCDGFLHELARRNGEEIMDFDTRFESALRELENAIGAINAVLVAHLFLKKLRLPGDKESQVTTGALNKYEYAALRDSAAACIPRAAMLRSGAPPPGPPRVDGPAGFHSRHLARPPPRPFGARQQAAPRGGHGVHAASVPDEPEGETEEPKEGYNDQNEVYAEGTDYNGDGDDCNYPEELEEAVAEHEAYMTQAKKYRADMEQAREFFRKPPAKGKGKGGKSEDSKQRLIKLKQRLPCARCGRTGHWKDDPECPLNAKGTQGPSGGSSFMVTSDVWQSSSPRLVQQILVDTACAKTVAGEPWAEAICEYYAKQFNHDVERVPEADPFRFGPGPVVRSKYALLVPCCWGRRGVPADSCGTARRAAPHGQTCHEIPAAYNRF